MVGPGAKREAVAHLQAVMALSERRACLLAGADRKMVRYRSRRPADTALRARLRELANERAALRLSAPVHACSDARVSPRGSIGSTVRKG